MVAGIVYVARVSVPKIIALRVEIGTRFPAARTSQGKVLLAALPEAEAAAALAEPSRSGLPAVTPPHAAEFRRELIRVRAQGWAVADEELAHDGLVDAAEDGAAVVFEGDEGAE